MSSFKPRVTVPEYGNKYYNKRGTGGYNPCIIGNYPYNSENPTGYFGLNVLPNCTGYATGRFAEIIGVPRCQYLGDTDARNYYRLALRQGLKVGKEPKLGACAVWDDGKYGHVGIVEQITNDTTIVISESGWYSKVPVWWATHRKGDGNWVEGNDTWMANYKFIGFIYNPAVEEGEDMTRAETEALIKAMVPSIVEITIEEIEKKKAKLPEDDWAHDAINMCIAKDIMIGYEDGFHAQSYIRREEVAQISENIQAYLKSIIKRYIKELLGDE